MLPGWLGSMSNGLVVRRIDTVGERAADLAENVCRRKTVRPAVGVPSSLVGERVEVLASEDKAVIRHQLWPAAHRIVSGRRPRFQSPKLGWLTSEFVTLPAGVE